MTKPEVGSVLANEAIVIAITWESHNEAIVLCMRKDNPYYPYVTWGAGITDVGGFHTYWGHYYQCIDEAVEDYVKRGGK